MITSGKFLGVGAGLILSIQTNGLRLGKLETRRTKTSLMISRRSSKHSPPPPCHPRQHQSWGRSRRSSPPCRDSWHRRHQIRRSWSCCPPLNHFQQSWSWTHHLLLLQRSLPWELGHHWMVYSGVRTHPKETARYLYFHLAMKHRDYILSNRLEEGEEGKNPPYIWGVPEA